MKKLLPVGVLLLIFHMAYTQEEVFDYSSKRIADSLKEGAHSIYRLDEATLDVLSPSRYIFKVHEIVTVLNASGSRHLSRRIFFDKFRTVENATIKVYNENGLLAKKYSKKDFAVKAAYDGISLATDDKVLELAVAIPGYPCTIEVEYVIKADGYIELPDWYINTNQMATETCRYTVSVPTNMDIRHRTVNIDLSPSIESVNNKKVYTWVAKNRKAKVIQSNGFQPNSYYPTIEVAPNSFEYDGHAGQFSDWKQFGEWNFTLYEEKKPFSESRVNEIRALVSKYENVQEKVSVLYDYLKTTMRYVSIQFGIGGFKPFPVKYVDEKKYGDCKALSNYMRYLLQVAGIKSYPALINAGYDLLPVDPLFPSSSFNHVILCVPASPDTIWLECTSKDLEAGFLGTFTENKNALLLTEHGGVLTKTPSSKPENNFSAVRTEIFLNDAGGAKAQTSIYCTGDIAQEIRQIKKLEPNDQKEIFVNQFYYKSSDSFAASSHNDSAQGHTMHLTLEFDKLFAFKAGNKFFFPQRVSLLSGDQIKTEVREIDFVFEYPYFKTDTTIIYLSKGFVPEELPAQKEIVNEFASYKKQVVYDSPDQIKIITSLILKKHVIPARQYVELKDFFSLVRESEEQNLVLKKL